MTYVIEGVFNGSPCKFSQKRGSEHRVDPTVEGKTPMKSHSRITTIFNEELSVIKTYYKPYNINISPSTPNPII